MHIGFFSSIVIDGCPTSGYELANEAIVEGLRSLGHRVSVIGFQLPRQRPAENVFPLAVTNLENAEASRWQKLLWLGRAHLKGLPVAAAKLTRFSETLLNSSIERNGPFDLHVVNSWQIAAAFPAFMSKPFCYISHNVEQLTAAENADTAKTAVLKYLYRREARLLKGLEEKLCRQASWIWTLSGPDLEKLAADGRSGSVLPLFVPESVATTSIVDKTIDIGMIGTWTWQANTLGLRWFLDEVLRCLPDGLKISIAGSVPNDIVKANPRIDFPGRVESASDFLSAAHVIALVSRGGTGVQLKTIEAFQAGHACVATSSSLRGVDTLPVNCRMSDDPAEFASALTDLLEASKAGNLPAADGKAFADRQRNALMDSLNKGLNAISP